MITIVGGGLARDFPLASRYAEGRFPLPSMKPEVYPRHRVCGEFISGVSRDTVRFAGYWRPFR